MNVGVIIFSRMDSKRLPGKALVEIGKRPMLGRVIDRANRIITLEDGKILSDINVK